VHINVVVVAADVVAVFAALLKYPFEYYF